MDETIHRAVTSHHSANYGTLATIPNAVMSLLCELGKLCRYSQSSDVTVNKHSFLLAISFPNLQSSDVTALQILAVSLIRRVVTSLLCK